MTISRLTNKARIAIYFFIMATINTYAGTLLAQNSDIRTDIQTPISLHSAIETAVLNHPDILIANYSLSRARNEVGSAKSYYLPEIDFVASNTITNQYQKYTGVNVSVDIPTIGSTDVEVERNIPRYSTQAAIEMRWNLYSGGKDSARLAGASANELRVYAKKMTILKDIITDVTKSFLLLAKRQIEYSQSKQRYAHAKEQHKTIASRYSSGMTSQLELDKSEISTLEEKTHLATSKKLLKDALIEYLNSIGLQPSQSINPEALKLSTIGEIGELDNIIDFYIPNRQPGLLTSNAELEKAESSLREIRSEYYPSVDIKSSYITTGRGDSISESQEDISRDNFYLGIEARWNIFDGFRSSNEVAAAHVEVSIKKLERIQAYKNIESRLIQAKERVLDLNSMLELSARKAEIALKEYKIAQTKFSNNAISELDLKDALLSTDAANAQLDIARIELLDAEFELLIEGGRLE